MLEFLTKTTFFAWMHLTSIREVQSESLIIALKDASAEMREKIFKNMSQRAAEMIRDDLDSKGPVRLSEVEPQQKEILQIVRRLADEGQIMLGAKGYDSYNHVQITQGNQLQ
jgi:flagellar motor switch protein FliG